MTISIDIQRLDPEAIIPSQAKASDAGYDLYSPADVVIRPGDRCTLSAQVAVAIPEGYVGYIKPRSGLAAQSGIDVLGGVIDSGYRGPLGVILLNTSAHEFRLAKGARMAQLVVQPVMDVAFNVVENLTASERGAGGFGSTGQ